MASQHLVRLAEALRKGLEIRRLASRDREAASTAAERLFTALSTSLESASRRVGFEVSPLRTAVEVDPKAKHGSLAALTLDLRPSLGLEIDDRCGLGLGVYFGFDATGYRDRLVWGIGGWGDAEWVERCLRLVAEKRSPDEPFVRTGETLYAGGPFGWFVLWAWSMAPDEVGGSSEAHLTKTIGSRLDDLLCRFRPRSANARAGSKKPAGRTA